MLHLRLSLIYALSIGTEVPCQTSEVQHMKILLASALLAFSAVTSFAADGPSIVGKWKIHSNIAGNESDSECTLTQTGNDIAGTCKGAEAPEAKVTGKVDGAKVTWQFDSDYNGTPLTIKYTATLDATGKVAGTVNVDPFGVEGDFTAIAEK